MVDSEKEDLASAVPHHRLTQSRFPNVGPLTGFENKPLRTTLRLPFFLLSLFILEGWGVDVDVASSLSTKDFAST